MGADFRKIALAKEKATFKLRPEGWEGAHHRTAEENLPDKGKNPSYQALR